MGPVISPMGPYFARWDPQLPITARMGPTLPKGTRISQMGPYLAEGTHVYRTGIWHLPLRYSVYYPSRVDFLQQSLFAGLGLRFCWFNVPTPLLEAVRPVSGD